jgi:predicted TIM-barrel fold metal-dependent hydrolase
MPLLQQLPNVSLSTGSNYTFHKGIESMVSRLGAERLLFGTGMPVAEPMMAVTHLLYAQISDDDKRRIGSENLRGLIGGIQR